MTGLLLQGGTVFDGLGAPGRVADMAVAGGRVVAVGDDPPAGLRRIDCHGLAVAPGFVDTHAHSDLVHLLDRPQPFKLLQGVTTEVVGNCGLTLAPLDAASAEVAATLWSGLAAGGAPIGPATAPPGGCWSGWPRPGWRGSTPRATSTRTTPGPPS
jgi:N-acyl-D-amino-acid deacylase